MISVQTGDLRSLADKLRSMPAELVSKSGGPVRFGLEKAGKVIATQAAQNARNLPVSNVAEIDDYIRTGKLADSMKVRTSRRPPPGVSERVTISAAAPYAIPVEFGTETMPARPFLRPAFDSKLQAALTEFREQLAKAIDRAWARGIKKGLISG